MERARGMVIAFFALCVVLASVFMNCDIDSARIKERARVESLMNSFDYQQAQERQLEAWR